MKNVVIATALLLISLIVIQTSCSTENPVVPSREDIVHRHRGSVAGVIKDRRGRSVEGVVVRSVSEGLVTVSDTSGHYRLSGLLAGDDEIEFLKEGYFDSTVNISLGLLEGIDLDTTVLVSRYSTVAGRLYDSDDTPINGVVGIAVQGQNVAPVFTTTGEYSLAGIAPGTVRLFMIRSGYGFGNVVKNIVADSVYSDIDIRWSGEGGRLFGTVVARDEEQQLQPVPDAAVSILGGILQSKTGPDGTFDIANVPSQGYVTLMVKAESPDGGDTLVAYFDGLTVLERWYRDLGDIEVKRVTIDTNGIFGYSEGHYTAEVHNSMSLELSSPVILLNTDEFAAFRYEWDLNNDGSSDTLTSSGRIVLGQQSGWNAGSSYTLRTRLRALSAVDGSQWISDWGDIVLTLENHVIIPTVQTPDTIVDVTSGESAELALTVEGSAPFHYRWLKKSGDSTVVYKDSVSSDNTIRLALASVTAGYNGAEFICVVKNTRGSDTSKVIGVRLLQDEFTVIFQPNNGNAADTQKVQGGATVDKPEAPRRDGYRPAGWFRDSSLTLPWVFESYTIWSDTTLYAKWEPIVYSIRYHHLEDGENHPDNPADYTIECPEIVLEDPFREGYEFRGWFLDSLFTDSIAIIESRSTTVIDLYAKWEGAASYEITTTVVGRGSVLPKSARVSEGKSVTFTLRPVHLSKLDSAKVNGQLVSPVFGDSITVTLETVTEDKTIEVWFSDADMFYVTFVSNGGTPVDTQRIEIQSDNVQYAATPPNPRREGYTFAGWYANSSFTSRWNFAAHSVMSNMTLYARWVDTGTGGTVTDGSGNVYTTVLIGDQEWTVENLRTTKYIDGTDIPHVPAASAWSVLTSAAYCYYNNTTDQDTIRKYGALYNWYIADPENKRRIVPPGWRIPTDEDWQELEDYLTNNGFNWTGVPDGSNRIGKALASSGGEWDSSASVGHVGNQQRVNNFTGWTGLPGGIRYSQGIFSRRGLHGYWWGIRKTSASPYDASLIRDGESLYKVSNAPQFGFSVRLIRKPEVFNITYHALHDGENHEDNPQTFTVLDSDIPLQNPTRPGYRFDGWFEESELENPFTVITPGTTGNVSVYAKWVPDVFTATFDSRGGSEPDPAEKPVTFAAAYGDLPVVTRTGYSFGGWWTEEDGGGRVYDFFAVTIASDHTLFARWTPVTYSITYHLDGGENHDDNPPNYTIESSDIILGQPSWDGCTFDGWFLDSDFTMPISIIDSGSTGDLNIHAKWNGNEYTVTFDPQGGSEPDPEERTVIFDAEYGSFPTVTREGYNFGGWWTEEGGRGTLITISCKVVIPDDHTLYARWWQPGTVTDFDGNTYTTVVIGTQEWLVENLRTTKYADGAEIPHVPDSEDWGNLTTPGYCYYNNTADEDSIAKFGALYNWYVFEAGRPIIEGWRLPSDSDWAALENYLIADGYNWDETTTGNKIGKSMASSGWEWNVNSMQGNVGNNQGINNRSGFTAFPGGYRSEYGNYSSLGTNGYWQSSSTVGHAWVVIRSLSSGSVSLGLINSTSTSITVPVVNRKINGISVRLMRDLD
ncbi:hypothetical protein CHISP_1204 [Chitinispirillum alkaliphilum]|nr:hypothetical protein CHISP_1204 [Chitinispirillum alkaliphilum]